jgi:hypothetical protein
MVMSWENAEILCGSYGERPTAARWGRLGLSAPLARRGREGLWEVKA